MMMTTAALPGVHRLALLLAGSLLLSGSSAGVARSASAEVAPSPTSAEALEREVRRYEDRIAVRPDDFDALVGAARSLNEAMAIRTNGNLPLVDGLQDTKAHRAIWSELAPRSLEHARRAHALRPDSVDAASALASAYMFYSSSLGIIRSILQGAGNEFREHAKRVVELDEKYEDALGDTLLGGFYLVAPWPIADDDVARAHYQRAEKLAPASVRNQYSLGVYWARQDESERAREHFQKAASMPCTQNTERLFCDWIQAESQRNLERLRRN